VKGLSEAMKNDNSQGQTNYGIVQSYKKNAFIKYK